MSDTPSGHQNWTSGKVLQLYPGGGNHDRTSDSVRASLNTFLNASGWSVDDLTPNQLHMLVGLMTERQNLLETVQSLNAALDQARDIADHDPLLPVYNRRAFMRELAKQISFCERYGTTVCLVYMDLDYFKALNDTLGHSTGDMALKSFVSIIKKHVRQSDLVGRMGGDEFAVLLLNAEEEQAAQKAGFFSDDLKEMEFGEASAAMSLDVSCGVAVWERGETPEHFIERADEAMYIQKRLKNKARA